MRGSTATPAATQSPSTEAPSPTHTTPLPPPASLASYMLRFDAVTFLSYLDALRATEGTKSVWLFHAGGCWLGLRGGGGWRRCCVQCRFAHALAPNSQMHKFAAHTPAPQPLTPFSRRPRAGCIA